MNKKIVLIVLLIHDFELSERNITYCDIEEAIGKQGFFKTADCDILLLIELLCHSSRKAVKLNPVHLTVAHTLRQKSDEVTDTA